MPLGLIEDGAFISFHIVVAALRVTSKKAKIPFETRNHKVCDSKFALGCFFVVVVVVVYLFVLAAPMACGSSWARDQT